MALVGYRYLSNYLSDINGSRIAHIFILTRHSRSIIDGIDRSKWLKLIL